MAVNALAVDSMLPALPAMARSLGLESGNQQQWIITIYLLGFGVAQIIYGPLADRFGRKPVLLVGLILYVVFSIVAACAVSLPMLLTARVLQGLGSAASRVLVVSIVRDCYSGSQMARVMSLSFIVFLAVPILAPSIGQIIMLFLPWRGIFGALAVFGLVVTVWTLLRLPETLHPGDRLPIKARRVLEAFRVTVTSRSAVGYMLAMTFILGGLFGFINSAQQIFANVFQAPRLFTSIFAGVAVFMALSSLLNSRIVSRLGTRPVSHFALLGYLVVTTLHMIISASRYETIWTFSILQAATMFCFGLVASNFGALAMEPLGHVAGTASSVQGFVTTAGGALLGFFVGQHFDGTTLPLEIGFTVYGFAALLLVLYAEHGRLFRRAGGHKGLM
jgi:DHA1 family bicyclomycin/chloramphenicol resistance-like MFS transporter